MLALKIDQQSIAHLLPSCAGFRIIMRFYIAIVLTATVTGCVSLEQSTCHRCRDCQSVASCTGCTTSESDSSGSHSNPGDPEATLGIDKRLHELSDRRVASLDLQATDAASPDRQAAQPFEPIAPRVIERMPLMVPHELETHLRYHQPGQRTAEAAQPDSAALPGQMDFFALANEQPSSFEHSTALPAQEPSQETPHTPQRVRRIPIEAIRDRQPDVMPATHADSTPSELEAPSTDVADHPGQLSRTQSSRRTIEADGARFLPANGHE